MKTNTKQYSNILITTDLNELHFRFRLLLTFTGIDSALQLHFAPLLSSPLRSSLAPLRVLRSCPSSFEKCSASAIFLHSKARRDLHSPPFSSFFPLVCNSCGLSAQQRSWLHSFEKYISCSRLNEMDVAKSSYFQRSKSAYLTFRLSNTYMNPSSTEKIFLHDSFPSHTLQWLVELIALNAPTGDSVSVARLLFAEFLVQPVIFVSSDEQLYYQFLTQFPFPLRPLRSLSLLWRIRNHPAIYHARKTGLANFRTPASSSS